MILIVPRSSYHDWHKEPLQQPRRSRHVHAMAMLRAGSANFKHARWAAANGRLWPSDCFAVHVVHYPLPPRSDMNGVTSASTAGGAGRYEYHATVQDSIDGLFGTNGPIGETPKYPTHSGGTCIPPPVCTAAISGYQRGAPSGDTMVSPQKWEALVQDLCRHRRAAHLPSTPTSADVQTLA